jgi:hypothetical protein
MFLAQIMKYALFSTFKGSAERLGGIVMYLPSGILFVTVVDPIMGGVLFANASIGAIFIGHQICILINKTR